MDPFWLSFRDKALERQFEKFVAERAHMARDRMYLYSSLMTTLWAMVEMDPNVTPFTNFVPLVFHALWLLVDLALRNALAIEGLLLVRTPLVVVYRLLQSVTHTLRTPFWFPGGVGANQSTAISIWLSGIGVWSEFAISLGLPLKFKTHLLLQFSSVLVFLASNTGICYQNLMHSRGKPLIALLAIQFGTSASLPEIMLTFFGFIWVNSGGQEPCLQLIVLWHVYFGFGLCSYIVWCWERSSRAAFLENAALKGYTNLPHIEFLTPMSILIQTTVIVVGFGLCWKAMVDTAYAVVAPGMMLM